MSKSQHDINDDEIRIISSETNDAKTSTKPRKRLGTFAVSIIAIGICALAAVLFFMLKPESGNDSDEAFIEDVPTIETIEVIVDKDSVALSQEKQLPSVAINDTTVQGTKLTIFTPLNATPHLHVGDDILNDSTPVLVVQAADIRSDNGKIVGAYVLDGELLSKGQAKSGYCAIINGRINIGVAETTPLLEQALETNGSFFRQYPLVVANQVVENKPKGKSQRKALAELNGRIVVIMSKDRLTFHDFSQSLVDLGVTNAIYLVGSTAHGFAKNDNNQKVEFGKKETNAPANVNYIFWQ